MRYVLGILSLMWKVYIGIIFVITAILFYPIITPFLVKKQSRKKAFKIFVIWSWTFRILCFYIVRKIEKNPLPKAPYIIVANHISYFDIFFMYSILPDNPFLFLGKSEILRYPLIKTYFKRMNIPVHRGDRHKSGRAFVQSKREITDGWSLVIFPEGGIPDHDLPRLIRFKDGAFQIAKSMRVPIVPLTFLNNHKLFSDPSKILGPARPGISYVFQHPFISAEKVDELEVVELKNLCREIIEQPILDRYPELKD